MRKIDIRTLYRDYGIQTAPAGNKHFLSGWINTHCPFCTGEKNYHLGYHERDGYFNCWRCGFKSPIFALSGVLNLPEPKIRVLLTPYYRREGALEAVYGTISPRSIHTYTPPNLTPLKTPQICFLTKRGFDPEELETVYQLKAMGPITLTGFAHRLFIPIFWQGKMVSWLARSVSEKTDAKYRPCPKEKETIFHKHILYGLEEVEGDSVVVVEGTSDVWRLGKGSVATFGTMTSSAQRSILLQRFKRIFILFDMDENEAGQIAGEKLAFSLSAGRAEVKQIFLEGFGDPGSMKKEDAKKLMKELKLKN